MKVVVCEEVLYLGVMMLVLEVLSLNFDSKEIKDVVTSLSLVMLLSKREVGY